MNNNKLLTNLIIGAAVGAVLGLLLAPDKGSETRKKIAQKSSDLGDDLKNKYGEVKETLKGKYDSIRSDANQIIDKERESKQNFG